MLEEEEPKPKPKQDSIKSEILAKELKLKEAKEEKPKTIIEDKLVTDYKAKNPFDEDNNDEIEEEPDNEIIEDEPIKTPKSDKVIYVMLLFFHIYSFFSIFSLIIL